MGFKLRSGNTTNFKSMGSSPAKQGERFDPNDPKQMEALKKIPKSVDPDAPGTPGKPGYEPPVKREDLDAKGKAIYDANKAKTKAKKKTKTLDDYLNEGFSQVEAEQMVKEGGVTGYDMQNKINKGRPAKKAASPKTKESPAKQGVVWGPKGDEKMMDAFPGDETKIERDRRKKTYRKPGESKYQSDVRRNKEQRAYLKGLPKANEEFHKLRERFAKDNTMKRPEAPLSPKKKKSPAKAKEDKTKFDTVKSTKGNKATKIAAANKAYNTEFTPDDDGVFRTKDGKTVKQVAVSQSKAKNA